MAKNKISFEVVYQQTCLLGESLSPCTAEAAIQQSGIFKLHPEIDFKKIGVGIFGHKITKDTLIQSGDRIELYRPLLIDPKKARKLRLFPSGPSLRA